MTNSNDDPRRSIALGILGLVVVIFIALSGMSFVSDRQRPDPEAIRFQGQSAVDGKRVFQAYNCMGCHTILGNGAYFAPDLTGVYATNGPAWLKAFLSSLEVWPTQAMVDPQIDSLIQTKDIDATSKSAYYDQFNGAQSDEQQRGGWEVLMPKLTFSDADTAALIAFLNYMSQINTQGWPPESKANPDLVDQVQTQLHAGFPGFRPTTTPAP